MTARSASTQVRNNPVTHVGRVSILAPAGSDPYYRLTWRKPDGRRGGTSGGRTLEGAMTKAAPIDASLARAMGPRGLTPLQDLVTAYINADDQNQRDDGVPWSGTHLRQVEQRLNRMIRGREHLQAMQMDRDLADVLRAQGGTRNSVDHNTSALRGLLIWGHRHHYFTAAQAEMLPAGAVRVLPALKGTAAPKRAGRARDVSENPNYIRDEDAPSIARIVALATEFDRIFPAWGRLAIELACDAGPRWGELFQLTADDVTFLKRAAVIAINWQIDASASVSEGDNRRKLPKGEKTRRTVAHKRSVTGYKLLKALRARCEEARREQTAGTNPEALLFPAPRGGMFHHSPFHEQYFTPAALAAGWPTQTWVETCDEWHSDTRHYETVTRECVQFDLVWHSMRHRFARTCVDVYNLQPGQLTAVGGWEDTNVVNERYYRSGREHLESVIAAL